jgi:hypothetical protein
MGETQGYMAEETRSWEESRKSQAGIVLDVFLRALASGSTFPFALYRQLAMVEVAARLATEAHLYGLSSSIGDLSEKKMKPNKLGLLGLG